MSSDVDREAKLVQMRFFFQLKMRWGTLMLTYLLGT